MNETGNICADCGAPEIKDSISGASVTHHSVDCARANAVFPRPEKCTSSSEKTNELGFFYDLACACLKGEPCDSEIHRTQLASSMFSHVCVWIEMQNAAKDES